MIIIPGKNQDPKILSCEFWKLIAKHKLNFENKTADMLTCLTKCSCIFEFGAMPRSEKRFSDWIQKVHKFVNFVDLFKSFLTIIY